jgi:hypothetical protein
MSDPIDDELAALAGALREETAEAAAPAATRARVLGSAAQGDRRAALALAAAAVLGIALGAPTVWAWSTGRLDPWLYPREQPAAPEAPADDHRVPRRGTPPPGRAELVMPRALAPEATAPEPEIALGADVPVEAEAVAASDDTARPARAPVDPVERRAYDAAHALHFRDRDPAGALGAWDRYLASYPRGHFAVEARWNRALCLVRLDRRGEARAALAPFASGAPEGYRTREATALLEALGP